MDENFNCVNYVCILLTTISRRFCEMKPGKETMVRTKQTERSYMVLRNSKLLPSLPTNHNAKSLTIDLNQENDSKDSKDEEQSVKSNQEERNADGKLSKDSDEISLGDGNLSVDDIKSIQDGKQDDQKVNKEEEKTA